MSDPITDLEAKLTAAARRRLERTARAGILRRRSGPGLTVIAAALAIAGSATAAAVHLRAEPSRPLAGPVDGPVDGPQQSARGYAVSLLPDLRAGQAGWCSLMRLSTRAVLQAAGMGCAPARSAGAAEIAAGGFAGNADSIEYVVVAARVRAVRFGQTPMTTRRDVSLPFGWRYVVRVTSTPAAARPDAITPPPPSGSGTQTPGRRSAIPPSLAPVLLDARSRSLPPTTPADDRVRPGRSRLVTRAAPARKCVIGDAPGFVAGYARVALSTPAIPRRLEGRAFFSCAYTVFHNRDSHGGLTAAILLDARHPDRRAAPLPATPGLRGRRLGPGWLVVYGDDPAQSARLLAHLASRL